MSQISKTKKPKIKKWRCSPCKSTECGHAKSLEEAAKILKEIMAENGEAWQKLRAKANWEQMTGVSIINSYGDPRLWK